MSTELTVQEQQPQKQSLIEVTERGCVFKDHSQLMRYATFMYDAKFAPKLPNPQAVFIVLDLGMRLGLPPLAAIQGIALVNNRPSLWGDTALGLVQSSPAFDHARFKEWTEGDALDDLVSYCTMARVGGEPHTQSFSWKQAKLAGLTTKDTYKSYPARMLMWRARGFCMRDLFADVLQGFITAEEAADTPGEPSAITVTATAPRTLEDLKARQKLSAERTEAAPAKRGRKKAEPAPVDDQVEVIEDAEVEPVQEDADAPSPSEVLLEEAREAIAQAESAGDVDALVNQTAPRLSQEDADALVSAAQLAKKKLREKPQQGELL